VDQPHNVRQDATKRPLLSTKALGLGVVSAGALALPAVLTPAANASGCWSHGCRAYVPNRNVNPYVREYGSFGSFVHQNIAHYYDCVQTQAWDPNNGSAKYTSPPACGRSPSSSGFFNGAGYYFYSRGTAWKTAGGCNNMWARELGTSLVHGGWGLYTC
jgi:hypothetical protein